MIPKTFQFPAESVRCQPGDYILQRNARGHIRVYRVDDLVMLSRLVPFFNGALIEQGLLLDSERPAFMDEIHLLLTAFDRDFASSEEATRALEAAELGSATEGLCRDIRRFPTSNSEVIRLPGAKAAGK